MPKPMLESELISQIQAHEGRAYGWGDGVLAIARAEAIRRFLAKPYGNEQEGRSKIVSTDLRDTVLWIMPQVMRTLFASDQVCRFTPRGPEDEAAAKLETEYINYVMLERNNAYQAFAAFCQDALVSGNGYAKVWWDKRTDVQVEKYTHKSDDELAALMQDADVEVVQHTAYPDPAFRPPPQPPMAMDPATGQPVMLPMPAAPMLHDVVVRRTRAVEFARYEAVPPEEILIGAESRNQPLQDVDFVQHRREVSLSELRQMGYDVPDDIADQFGDSDPRHSQEEIARNRFSSEYIPGAGDDAVGPAMRRVVYRETYLRVDFDGDGIGELRKVCHVGDTVLANDETDLIPIVSFVAIPFAHRHHGISHHELINDIAEARTEIMRAYLDGLKVNVRPRLAIDAARVNQNDLLVARPNGLVRTQGAPQESIMPLPVSDTGGMAMAGLQWLDAWRMDASGINQAMQSGQSVDAAALNRTALGMSQQLSMALARVENITRSLADGVRDLMLLMHAMTLKHSSKAEHVRLNNQWALIDPREWVKRADLTVTVALGSGTREMRAAQMQALVQQLQQLAPLGIVTPQNLYAAVSRLVNELGLRNADEFVTNPAQQPPAPPPPPDPIVQAQQIKSQADMQIEQARLQAKAQDDARQAQLEQQNASLKVEMAQREAQLKAELERYKAQLASESAIQVAKVKAEIEAQTALQVEELRLRAKGIDAGMSASMDEYRASIQDIGATVAQMAAAVESIAREAARKASGRIVRDARGRVAGLADETGTLITAVERDENGRIAGVRPGSIQ